MPFSVDFIHDLTGLRLVVAVDTRVAWAYLLEGEADIIADVWLFNLVSAPAELELEGEPPFLNSAALAAPFDQSTDFVADDFSVEWLLDGELLLAELFLNGVLVARLSPGASPGWSAFARSDGPLALAL